MDRIRPGNRIMEASLESIRQQSDLTMTGGSQITDVRSTNVQSGL